jgi:hypothetical protein
MRSLVVLAGIGQLLLAAASLAIPGVLGWREETRRLRPLTRQVFWTYAAYILASHVAFGLLSLLAPDSLLDRTPLAAAVSGFVALWWSARLVLQLACFDRSARPGGKLYALAEAALFAAFLANASVYGAALSHDLAGTP